MKDPKRWQDILIDSPFGKLTKKDIFDYYADPKIRGHILDATGGREAIIRQSFSPGQVVLRRKDPAGKLIDLSKQYDDFNERRMTEAHATFGKKTDHLLVDIDPGSKVPWENVKSMADTIAKTFQSQPDIKKVDVQFSGDRGFYVRGHLEKEMGIDKARERVKEVLDGLVKRPDTTFGVAGPKEIRLDTSIFKNRGSVKAPYSLSARTGLVSAPVKLEDMPKVEKEDFRIEKIVKKASEKYRERVEIFARLPNGKILAGHYPNADQPKNVAVPGGGVEPGENKLEAALREFKEETGYTAAKVSPLSIKPMAEPWSRWMRESTNPEMIQRMKDFPAGSRTHYLLADIADPKREVPGDAPDWMSTLKPQSIAKLVSIQAKALSKELAREDRVRMQKRLEALQSIQKNAEEKVPAVRYEHKGQGVYEALRDKNPELHEKLLHDKRYAWLGQPKRYPKNSKAFFTEAGDKVYQKKTLPLHEKELGRVKRIAEQIAKGHVLFKDKHQVIKKAAPIEEGFDLIRFLDAFDEHIPQFMNYLKKRQARQQVAQRQEPEGQPRLPVTKFGEEEFAPGIPMDRHIDRIPSIKNKAWTLAVQKHEALKAGPHFDFRLVDPETGKAHSFAVPKMRLPKAGEPMLLAIQQPTHTADYALHFEGEIPKGTYGAGKVTLPIKEQIQVIKSNADRIHLQRENGDELVMFRTKGNNWGLKAKEK